MSIEQQPENKANPKVYTRPEQWGRRGKLKGDFIVPDPEHQDDKHESKRIPLWKKVAVGTVAFGAAGGVAYAVSQSGEAPEKKETQELVLGPDGEALQYVPYSEEHSDRDNSGHDDKLTDINRNSIDDNYELWDQENQKFVNPEEGVDQLANASEEDLSNISEIETTFAFSPDGFWGSNPHWKAEFIALDPLVKDRVMVSTRSREDYESDKFWEADVQYQFGRTPEDIRN